MSAERHHPGHANVWATFAAAALAGSRATTFEARAEVVVESAAEDADELLEQWIKRFPDEAPPNNEGR